MQNLLTARG
ncbi:hypothetical protein D031_3020A, partial [Vibrio parahaemolyticus VP-48]